jgi:hypothetical protein
VVQRPHVHNAPRAAGVHVVLLAETDVSRPMIDPGVDPELQTLIRKCWSQSAAVRPPFDEVIRLLRGKPTMIISSSTGGMLAAGGGMLARRGQMAALRSR